MVVLIPERFPACGLEELEKIIGQMIAVVETRRRLRLHREWSLSHHVYSIVCRGENMDYDSQSCFVKGSRRWQVRLFD